MPKVTKSIREAGEQAEEEAITEFLSSAEDEVTSPGVAEVEALVAPTVTSKGQMGYYEQRQAEEAVLVEALRDVLDLPVPAEIIKKRTGPKGMQLSYISGEGAIRLANKLFGWERWSTNVLNINIVNDNEGAPKLVYATVEVSAFSTIKQDVGTCGIDGRTDLEMAIKGAVTDGTKRALRLFGEHMGNSLYADPVGQTEAPAAYHVEPNTDRVLPTPTAQAVGVTGSFQCEVPGCNNKIEDWTNDEGRTFTASYRAERSRKIAGGKVLCGKHLKEYQNK